MVPAAAAAETHVDGLMPTCPINPSSRNREPVDVAGGVLVAVGIGLIVFAVALPFLIFNSDSEDGAEAFGSVIVGIAIMFGLTPILVLIGIVLVVLGVVRLVRTPKPG